MQNFKIQDHPFQIDLANTLNSPTFEVQSFPRSYKVKWDNEPIPAKSIFRALSANSNPLLFIDHNVLALYGAASPELAGYPKNKIFVFHASEETKTLEGMTPVLDFLNDNQATKSDPLIIVGGGIAQDVGTFAAKVFKRGIPTVLFPTTLLSQSDSSIGGKSGLNYRAAKNQVALFAPPTEVIVNPHFLPTLTPNDLASGMGEVLKLHIIGGPGMLESYQRIRRNIPDLSSSMDFPALTPLIRGALAVKRAVIEEDEFEQNLRKSMNYGHTLGHTLETLSQYSIPHGLAVVAGIVLVNELSMKRGWLPQEQNQHLKDLAFELLTPTVLETMKKLSFNDVLEILQKDKKAEKKTVDFVILHAIGDLRFHRLPLNEELQQEVQMCFESCFVKEV